MVGDVVEGAGSQPPGRGRRSRYRASWAAVLAGMLWLLCAHAAAAQEVRNVLVIYDSDPTLPYIKLFDQGLRSAIVDAATNRIHFFTEYFDVERFSSARQAGAFIELVRERYAAIRIAAVVSVGPRAFEFMTARKQELFPDIPLVYGLTHPERVASLSLPPDVVGVPVDFNAKATIELALRFQPDARRLVLVTGAGSWDRDWERRLRGIATEIAGRLQVEYLAGLPASRLFERLGGLPRDAIVLTPGYFHDGAGQISIPRDTAEAIAKHSSAPVYVLYDTHVGVGAVGGIIPTFEASGRQAGAIVAALLAGKHPAELSLPDVQRGEPIVDWRQAQRWGISEKLFPPGTVVRFRPPTAWEQYRWQIVLIAVALAAQTALIVYILAQKRRRRAVEDSLAASENRVALTTASTNSGLWSLATEDQPVQATQSCAALFGLEGDRPFTVADLSLRVHAEDRRLFLRTMLSALRHAAPVDFRFRTIGRDDRLRWIAAKGSWIPSGDGQATALTGIFTDVTELKKLEHERDQQRLEVTHLMRQSVVNQLSGSIAHELSQPLGAIMLNAEAALDVLDRERPDIEVVRASLRGIVERDVHASDIVGRVRRMIRKGGAKFEPIEIEKLFEATDVLLRNELVRRGIVMEMEYPPNMPAVVGDFVQLQQVLINFLMNAMEAMNGSVPTEKKIVLSAESNGGFVRLAVFDNGPGIADGIRGQVLEAFVTTKPDGLGLGLSICDGLAKAHGGRISVENNPHGGATAALILPVQAAEGR